MRHIVLVFPPITEARLFPYLSLPMLTGYLRKYGLKVEQRDLNIELCHELFTPAHFEELRGHLSASHDRSLSKRYRAALCDYLSIKAEALRSSVFKKGKPTNAGIQHDVRFVRHGIELLLEGSRLQAKDESFDAADETVLSFHQGDASRAEATLRSLVVEIMSRQPLILGISLTFFSQLPSALLIARWAKEVDRSVCVVLGGQHVMLWYEQLVQLASVRRWVDGLCIGPGEECLHQLWQALDDKRHRDTVPELIWVVGSSSEIPLRSRLNINELPTPDFKGLPIEGYIAEETHLNIITCVGCYWGRCTFCSYGNRSAFDRGYQQATSMWIAERCRELIDEYSISRINFVDENTNLKVVLAAMRRLRNQGYQMQFSTRNRMEVKLLDLDFCRALAEHGCVLMSIGYETNSQRLLDRLDKGVFAEHYQRIVDNLHEAGITLRLSILGGIPGETSAELAESIAFLRLNADRIGIDVMQMLVMEPKTRFAKDSAASGVDPVGSRLRGNQLLNYRFGRVGFAFDYAEGDNFDDRLAAFIELFHTVDPQKNDELAPHRRHDAPQGPRLANVIRGVRLQPWVRVLPAPTRENAGREACVLADLLWERFYTLPVDLGDERVLVAPREDPRASALMASLVRLGLVDAVYREGSTT